MSELPVIPYTTYFQRDRVCNKQVVGGKFTGHEVLLMPGNRCPDDQSGKLLR